MAGVNRIWRIGASETNGSVTNPNNEIIEFDETPVPTKGQFFTQSEIDVIVDITQTNALKGDINPSQDGGVGSVRYVVTGIIKGKPALDGRKKLLKWLLEDKTTTNFPHGRFGTSFTNIPELSVTPNGNADTGYGWLLEDMKLIKDAEWDTKTSFILTLKFNGRKTGITNNL